MDELIFLRHEVLIDIADPGKKRGAQSQLLELVGVGLALLDFRADPLAQLEQDSIVNKVV